MGRIIVEVVDNKLIVTRYDSEGGSVIPDRITQNKKVVAIINGNLDTDSVADKSREVGEGILAINRKGFLMKLLSLSEACAKRYSVYGRGLYSEKDMDEGITWAEVAYLLHYVGGIKRSLDWSNIKPTNGLKVCVLHEVERSGKVLDEKLASYKNRLDMGNYINSIISGKRYIPLPMYCAFIDLLYNDDLGIDLDIDEMFKKLSQKEFETMFQ